MKLRTVLAALALTLAGTAAAYNIKDTLQPFSVYTGSNTTPSIQAATNGQVTLGPVGTTQPVIVSGGIKGGTAGALPCTGCVGESSGGATGTTLTLAVSNLATPAVAASLSLTAGNWLVLSAGAAYVSVSPSVGIIGCDLSLVDTTNNFTIQNEQVCATSSGPAVAGQNTTCTFALVGYRSLSAPATMTTRVQTNAVSGLGTGGQCSTRASGTMYAIRMP